MLLHLVRVRVTVRVRVRVRASSYFSTWSFASERSSFASR